MIFQAKNLTDRSHLRMQLSGGALGTATLLPWTHYRLIWRDSMVAGKETQYRQVDGLSSDISCSTQNNPQVKTEV